jgi:hypothetical protein
VYLRITTPSCCFLFVRIPSTMMPLKTTPASASCLRQVTSRSRSAITSRSFVSFSKQINNFLPSTSLNRLQQLDKHFSSSSAANMSESNQHFLLENVFNVKGKVSHHQLLEIHLFDLSLICSGCSCHWWWIWNWFDGFTSIGNFHSRFRVSQHC